MAHILTAAVLALALSAPGLANACDITTDPVSQDEVEAAGLGPLLRQADQQLHDDTQALIEQVKTKEQAEAMTPPSSRCRTPTITAWSSSPSAHAAARLTEAVIYLYRTNVGESHEWSGIVEND
jgi:hypothetical protein